MTPVQILAVWFIASVLAAPLIGEYLHNRRINREWQAWLDAEINDRWLGNYADAITRDDEPFMLDEPSQPKRSA